MGSPSHTPVPVDPQALAAAKNLWANFTKMATWGVVATAVILGLMALFLV